MKDVIAASILSADFAHLGDDTRAVLDAGVDRIHFDVMDHHFVPNLSFGALVCQALRKDGIDAPIDVHLMVEHPEQYIEPFARAGASMILFHPDTTQQVDQLINEINQAGMQAGLVFNPQQEVIVSAEQLTRLDMILLMSVNPGFGGQSFIPSVFEKIQATRTLLSTQNKPFFLGVDGGIKTDNIAKVKQAGANYLVVGSGLFSSDHYVERVKQLKAALN